MMDTLRFIASSPLLVGALAGVWVLAALITAVGMRSGGRRFWVWFAVSLFCSVIPGTIVAHVDCLRALRRQRTAAAGDGRRCRHCGRLLPETGLERAGAQAICPTCGMVVEEDFLA